MKQFFSGGALFLFAASIASVSHSSAFAEASSGDYYSNRSIVSISDRIDDSHHSSTVNRKAYRGWYYLVDRLLSDGIDSDTVTGIYNNSRIPAFEAVFFEIAPKESSKLYDQFDKPLRLRLAEACYNKHYDHFKRAEVEYGVPSGVIAAILYIETSCGQITGTNRIIHRLSRLASVGEPRNLKLNFQRHLAEDSTVSFGDSVARALYLEEIFYPQITALIKIAEMFDNNIFEIKGSSAGAFGFSQFLPKSYLDFGADGDGDQRVSLFNIPDAVYSTANYLNKNGWNPDLPPARNRLPIWHYNRSDSYIDAVIAVANHLSAGQ